MTRCLDYNDFAALLDNCLPPPEKRELLRHLGRCPSCLVMAADLEYEVPRDPALVATELAEEAQVPVLQNTAAGPSELGRAPTAEGPGWSEAANPVSVSAAHEPLLGRVIAGYRVQRELGRGGMGAVYEAVHERMNQRAAVKVMFPEFSRDPDFIRRFRAEARAASVVRHPGLVTIFNHGQLPSGVAYIMMEYLAGETLSRRMQSRRLTVPETLRLVRQIASALGAVHQQGIVHRDLKPENVMIVPDADLPTGERTKVVDFGIAKLNAVLQTNPEKAATAQRAFVGTVAYASPEQCRLSSSLDGKSDVYSLGIMMYEMLSGDLPFSGSVTEVLEHHRSVVPKPLTTLLPDLPPKVAALVKAMTAKEPAARPTMAEVRDQIDALMAPTAKTARGPLIVGAGVVLLLGAALALLRALGHL